MGFFDTIKKVVSDIISAFSTSTTHSSNVKMQYSSSDFSKYYQKWDENYNKELGYEYFKICTQPSKFPLYNSMESRLTNARISSELTQKEAAQAIGISSSALSSYENGNTVPTDEKLKIISEVYNIPFEFFKNGFVNDLFCHIRSAILCREEDYITSLRISAGAAEKMFPELLSEQDKEICQIVAVALMKNVIIPSEEAIGGEPQPVLAEMKSALLPIDTSVECNLEELSVGDSLRFIPSPSNIDYNRVKIFVNDKYICCLSNGKIKTSIFDILTHRELVPSSIEAIVTKINKKSIRADIIYKCNPTVLVDKNNVYHHSSSCYKLHGKSVKTKLNLAKDENLTPCENCCEYEPPRFDY